MLDLLKAVLKPGNYPSICHISIELGMRYHTHTSSQSLSLT